MGLLEREETLAAVEDRIEAARRGQGSLVALGGEAGIGKSAVVDAVRLRLERVRFLVGHCDSLETPRPLGPLLDIAKDRASGLSRLVADGVARHLLFEAVLDEMGSTLRPTLLVIEDAHWADEATLDLIRFLGRRVGSTHGVLVVTYRDDEVGPQHPLRVVLGDLATARGLLRVSLSPLSVDAVRVLAEDSGVDAYALHRMSGGNPFFVTEALAAGGDEVPSTVADAVLARAARLGREARRLVDAVSIVPDRAPSSLIERLVSVAGEARAEAIERGLLVAYEEGLRFRHELARRSVEQALAADERRGLHRAALEALEADPRAEPAQLAHHAHHAGDDKRLVRWALKAAEVATERGAFAEAFVNDQRALSRPSLTGEDRARVLERLGEAARETNRPADGVAALEEAVAIWRSIGEHDREAAALALLAMAEWTVGRGERADETIEAATRLISGAPGSREVLTVLEVAAALAMLRRRSADAVALGTRAVGLAEALGDSAATVVPLFVLGAAKIVSGRLGGVADMRRALEVAERAGLHSHHGRVLGNLGTALGEVRRYEEAVPWLEEAIADGERLDRDYQVDYCRAWLSRIHFEQGRWGAAALLAQRSMHSDTAAPIIRIVALTVLGRVAARRGDPALTHLHQASRLAAATGDLQRTWPVASGLAEVEWLRGRAERIPEIVAGLYEDAVELEVPWARGELALWLWRAGSLGEAPAGLPLPVALQVAGDWRAAAAAWEDLGCPYEAAEALTAGDDDACLQAMAVFDSLGARPAARRVRQMLRQRGVSVPRGPRPSTTAHPEGLTSRQAEVLGLLAEGMSNADIAARLFISEKTVAHHVSAILTRLGVSSRGEAAAEARRLDEKAAASGADTAARSSHTPRP